MDDGHVPLMIQLQTIVQRLILLRRLYSVLQFKLIPGLLSNIGKRLEMLVLVYLVVTHPFLTYSE